MSKAQTQSTGRSLLWLQGLICGATVTLMPATGLVVGVFMGPAFAAAICESTPGRPVGRVMIMLAAATVISPLRGLWEQGNSFDAAMAMISDPTKLAFSWLAAACGWVISEGAALAASAIGDVLVRRECKQLELERKNLEDEWGKAGD